MKTVDTEELFPGKAKGNGEEQQLKHKTIDAQAFTLFESGRTPIDVAIELDLKSDEAGFTRSIVS